MLAYVFNRPLPPALEGSGRPCARSSLELEPFHRPALGSAGSRGMGAHRQPLLYSSACFSSPSGRGCGRSSFYRAASELADAAAALSARPRLVRARTWRARAEENRVFQHGIRAGGILADLLRGARHSGRGLPESRERLRGTCRGNWTPLPTGILSTDADSGWPARRGLSLQRSHDAPGHSCLKPRRRLASDSLGLAGATDFIAGLASPRGEGDAIFAGQQRSPQFPSRPRRHRSPLPHGREGAPDAGDHSGHRGVARA